MRRRSRTAGLVVGIIALAASPASAALAPGCVNPNDSALNQYCDSLPAAAGGQVPPRAGTPALITVLPGRVVWQINRTRGSRPEQARVRQKLLRLPAPERPDSSVIGASSAAFPSWLIVLMAALALVLGAAALARSRRRRRRPLPRVSPA